MDQVDRRIGLEQVAPDPQARIRLAGHQQHPQPVAHAIDEEHLAVVQGGDLARRRVGLELEHRLARPAQLERQAPRGPGQDRNPLPGLAVLAERDRDRLAGVTCGQLVDPKRDLLLVADHAVVRHLLDHQTPIALVVLAGQQQVHRRVDRERFEALRHIVDLPVGQDQDARESRAVDLRQRRAQRREQPGAALAVAGAGRLDHLEALDLLQFGAQLEQRLLELLRPLADGLRRRAVDQQHRDVVERLTLLLDNHRVGQRQHAQGQHRAAPEDTARPSPHPQSGDHEDRERERGQRRPGQQRGETQRGAAHHWPRRSSRAGMCTWSVL